MGIQEELITALRGSSSWTTSAYILTYDEHGGYVDHVAPPVLDAFGAGIRVPTWVISPYAKRSHIEGSMYEHTSTLKFMENVFGLPTLASVNHSSTSRPLLAPTTRPRRVASGLPLPRAIASTRSATSLSASTF